MDAKGRIPIAERGEKRAVVAACVIANTFDLEIRITDGPRTRVLYRSPNEAFIYFAEAFWSRDESQVAVLVTGMASFPVAHDLRSQQMIPFDRLKAGMNSAIAKEYGRSEAEDLVAWAWTDDAWSAFRKRHPAAVNH